MKIFKSSFLVFPIILISFLGLSLFTEKSPSEISVNTFGKIAESEETESKSIAVEKVEVSKSVFEVADSICLEAGVPFELVKEIGDNESGWRYIKNTNGGTDNGDLQVIDATYWYMYDKLDLVGGKTRRNYLKVGIYFLKDMHNRYGSWRKARFAYGRGKWRNESTWTALEHRFMGKIDWSKYDN